MKLTTSCAVICLINALTCMAGPSGIAHGKPYSGHLTQSQRNDQPERLARERDSEGSSSSEESDSSEGTESSEVNTVPPCPDGWFLYGKSCYLEGLFFKTWNDARMACQAQGSDLVEINNEAEMAFISTLPNSGSIIWTGLTDLITEGDFVWISSGSSLFFSDWAPGQPYGGDQRYDCVVIYGFQGWKTQKCNPANPYLCERQADMSGSR